MKFSVTSLLVAFATVQSADAFIGTSRGYVQSSSMRGSGGLAPLMAKGDDDINMAPVARKRDPSEVNKKKSSGGGMFGGFSTGKKTIRIDPDEMRASQAQADSDGDVDNGGETGKEKQINEAPVAAPKVLKPSSSFSSSSSVKTIKENVKANVNFAAKDENEKNEKKEKNGKKEEAVTVAKASASPNANANPFANMMQPPKPKPAAQKREEKEKENEKQVTDSPLNKATKADIYSKPIVKAQTPQKPNSNTESNNSSSNSDSKSSGSSVTQTASSGAGVESGKITAPPNTADTTNTKDFLKGALKAINTGAKAGDAVEVNNPVKSNKAVEAASGSSADQDLLKAATASIQATYVRRANMEAERVAVLAKAATASTTVTPKPVESAAVTSTASSIFGTAKTSISKSTDKSTDTDTDTGKSEKSDIATGVAVAKKSKSKTPIPTTSATSSVGGGSAEGILVGNMVDKSAGLSGIFGLGKAKEKEKEGVIDTNKTIKGGNSISKDANKDDISSFIKKLEKGSISSSEAIEKVKKTEARLVSGRENTKLKLAFSSAVGAAGIGFVVGVLGAIAEYGKIENVEYLPSGLAAVLGGGVFYLTFAVAGKDGTSPHSDTIIRVIDTIGKPTLQAQQDLTMYIKDSIENKNTAILNELDETKKSLEAIPTVVVDMIKTTVEQTVEDIKAAPERFVENTKKSVETYIEDTKNAFLRKKDEVTADLAALPRNVKSDFETSVKTSSSRLVEDVKNAPTVAADALQKEISSIPKKVKLAVAKTKDNLVQEASRQLDPEVLKAKLIRAAEAKKKELLG